MTDDDRKQTFIWLYLLKKLDLRPEDGGLALPAVLPSELAPLDEVLQDMAVAGLVEIDMKKGVWRMTKQGVAYLGEVIDEASALVDEFEDDEPEEVVEELRRRNLDPLRARFLWGWFEGEYDDLVLWQERRGVAPVERMWAYYLVSDAFVEELAKDVDGEGEGEDDEGGGVAGLLDN